MSQTVVVTGGATGMGAAAAESLVELGAGSITDVSTEALEVLTTFALCGFANLGSVGIQLGGIGALVPERRSEIAKIAFLALFGGFTASLLNASIAAVLLP